jgi:indolepyruvate ferredoxin oxidoreductase
MAVHLDGNQVTTLDLTGLAQKYGAVTSHIRIARDRDQLNTYRLASATADVVIGCDLIVTAGNETVERMKSGHTRVVVNTEISPTRAFARDPDWTVDTDGLVARIAERAGHVDRIAATRIARELLGDPVGANMFMLGFAWQRGWVGVSRVALERAIELNGVAVAFNSSSFNWGRVAAHDPEQLQRALRPENGGRQAAVKLDRLADIVAHRSGELAAWQNGAYANRYRKVVDRIAGVERSVANGIGAQGDKERLATAVARYYYKLLAYKDEFEVARLHASPAFREELERNFEGDFKLRFHLGAGPFARYVEGSDKPRKREVGAWIMPVFSVLSKLRFLRGSFADPFRNGAERKLALESIARYEADLERIAAELDADRLDLAVEIASWPEHLRGFGHVRQAHAIRVIEKRDELWSRWEGLSKRSAR